MSGNNGQIEAAITDLGFPKLPKTWCWATVGDVGEVRLGRQRSPKNRSDKYPTKYLRAANLTWDGLDLSDVLDMDFSPSEVETYRLLAGDVLLSEASGSADEVGKPAVWNEELEDCCFQNTVIRFRPSVVASRFAHTIFLHFARNGLFARVGKGVGIHHLSAARFSKMPFPVAPANEQTRIVAKIDELFSDLDAGVAALERAKAKLKQYRASVLKAAIEGRLTEQWRADNPDVEPASKLLERILIERRKKWEEEQLRKYQEKGKEPPKNWKAKYKEPASVDTSTLPALPEVWCWATVEQLGFVDVGHAFRSKDFAESGTRLLRGDNMEPGALRWTNTKFWPNDKLDGYKHLFVNEGDILLAMDRPLISSGLKIARAKPSDVPCLLVQRMARFRLIEKEIAEFLFVSCRNQSFISHLVGGQTGTQLPHISGGGISSFATPLPPLIEQREICAEVDRRLSVVDQIDIQADANLKRAARLRQSILKRAFEGKLVPQDPNDEPAISLLERIHAKEGNPKTNGSKEKPATKRKRKAKAKG